MTPHRMAHIPCHDVIRSVWDYLDDEIDLERKEQIRDHLAVCDHCRDHYGFERAFLRSLGRLLDTDDDRTPLRARIESALAAQGYSRV